MTVKIRHLAVATLVAQSVHLSSLFHALTATHTRVHLTSLSPTHAKTQRGRQAVEEGGGRKERKKERQTDLRQGGERPAPEAGRRETSAPETS
jgi:hypothetical protein